MNCENLLFINFLHNGPICLGPFEDLNCTFRAFWLSCPLSEGGMGSLWKKLIPSCDL
uniref:Uncharacterized protein n=1 Tax=Lepeophtheirus salmonis TaxID=72036 RepID=A0A0K2UXD7_LEPSM